MADLTPPLKGYSLWFETSGKDHDRLQELVDDLAAAFGTRPFRAHATLLGLLEKEPEDLGGIKEHCEMLARGAKGLMTEVTGVSARNAHFQAVFMPVVPNLKLLELSKRARELFGHENDPPFMPHWSALYGDLSHGDKLQASDRIWERISFPLVVPITDITLVAVAGYPDEWHVIERFPLT